MYFNMRKLENMNLNNVLKKISMRSYFRKNYDKFCEELGIDKSYAKKLKRNKSRFLFNSNTLDKIKSDDKLKEHLRYCYIILILEDLRLFDSMYNYDKYFYLYYKEHEQDIDILINLLKDRRYKYNGFLFQNLFCLKTSLIEPFTQLDNINNLDISDKQKEKERKDTENEMYIVFDSLFKMVNKLNDEYMVEINSTEGKIIKSGALDDLKKYNNLLKNMQIDMEKRIGIF